jgi:hypothetical protein
MCPVRSITYVSGRSLLDQVRHPTPVTKVAVRCNRHDLLSKKRARSSGSRALWLSSGGHGQNPGQVAAQFYLQQAVLGCEDDLAHERTDDVRRLRT